MRAKLVRESIGGAGGAGYSVWGGGTGRSFGNPGGRGFGFGSSQSSGGPNLMYTYDIKPLNQLLQQQGTPQGNDRYIHVGTEVKGKVLGKDKEIHGKIIDIKEDAEHNIQYYTVMEFDSAEKFRVDPTSVEILSHEERPNHYMRDFTLKEEFYPSLPEFIQN